MWLFESPNPGTWQGCCALDNKGTATAFIRVPFHSQSLSFFDEVLLC